MLRLEVELSRTFNRRMVNNSSLVCMRLVTLNHIEYITIIDKQPLTSPFSSFCLRNIYALDGFHLDKREKFDCMG